MQPELLTNWTASRSIWSTWKIWSLTSKRPLPRSGRPGTPAL